MAASTFVRGVARRIPLNRRSISTSSPALLRIRFFSFLDPIFNRVDEARIKECGPDRAAAEWIVRCGGSVRWVGAERYHSDYNSLPTGRTAIEAIDATDTCIMDIAFPYLKDLKHLKELDLTSCPNVDDNCLRLLVKYRQEDGLQKLKIEACPSVTDAGLDRLVGLKALQSLDLSKL